VVDGHEVSIAQWAATGQPGVKRCHDKANAIPLKARGGGNEQAVLVDCPDARVGRPRHPDVREHVAVAAYDGSELVRLASFQDGFDVGDNVDGGWDTILRRNGFAWKDTRRRDRYSDRTRR
jgi:hypothetical protein